MKKYYGVCLLILNVLTLFCCTDYAGKIKKSKKNVIPVHSYLQSLPVPSGLGVNIHFYHGNEQDWTLLQKAGIDLVRMDVSWAGSEKISNQYDFSRYDQMMLDLEKRHMRLMFIIDYGSPLYDDGLAPHTDQGRAASVRFCTALASHYAGKEIIWELWNEPNFEKFWSPAANVDDYIAWCKAVVPAIRRADPKACIVGPAASGFDIEFLDACFRKGILELVDGVTVHPYRNADRGPETAIDEYRQLAVLIDTYKPKGKTIPILSGEWGYSSALVSRELQGKYLARQWLCNILSDVPISIWYDWHDDGKDAQETEHNFGTVTWDYQPKPAYLAMKTLIEQLKSYRPLARMGFWGPNDYVVPFFKNGKIILIAWTTDPAHQLDLGHDLKIASAVDYQGQPINITATGAIMVDNGPQYVSTASPWPPWLQMAATAYQLEEEQALAIAQEILGDRKSVNPFYRQLTKAMAGSAGRERSAALYAVMEIAGKLRQNGLDMLGLYHFLLQNQADGEVMKKTLYRLAALSSPASMEIVAPLAPNPELGQTVAVYYLQMAGQMAQRHQLEQAESLLVYAAGFSQNRYLIQKAFEQIEQAKLSAPIKKSDLAAQIGFIANWWIAGPFPNANNTAETDSFFPERNIDFQQSAVCDGLPASWQQVILDDIFGVIPLAKIYGQKQLAAYAYAELNFPAARTALFKIGSNDGVVCWLNRELVHEHLTARPLTVDEDLVRVNLIKGRNRILLKIPNQGANWEICLRVCDQEGRPLDLHDYLVEADVKTKG